LIDKERYGRFLKEWRLSTQNARLDFSIVSVGSVITMEGGVCKDARIALGAVAPTPIGATKAEEAIKGKAIDAATADEAANAAVAGATPLAMNAYNVQIAKTLAKRALLA